MLKIAHRGYSSKYRDNSIDAFIGAIIEGFDMIELDIQLCKNDDIVVCHDIQIHNKNVVDMTIEELEELGIISLTTFLQVIDSTHIKVYLDLKGSVRLAAKLIDFIHTNKTDIYLPNIVIASFNRNMLYIIKNSNIHVRLGYITSSNYSENEWNLLTEIIDFVCISKEQLDHDTINYLHTINKQVFTYTCHNQSELKYIQEYNVDGIVSNILIE